MEKISYVENLTNFFTKTLFSIVFDDHRDSIGVKYILNMI